MSQHPLKAVHRRLEKAGERALLSWIGHPLVQATVTAVRPAAKEMISPLSRHVSDRRNVAIFAAHALGVTARYADGSEWADPPQVWELDEAERASFTEVTIAFSVMLVHCAQGLAANDVDIDPVAREDRFALAQLLLLPIKFGLTAKEVIPQLIVLPPGGITPDGTGHFSSRHTSTAVERDLVTVKLAYRDETGQSHIPVLYAGGGERRQTSSVEVQVRRTALRSVREAHPECTVPQLLKEWNSAPTTAGGLFRTKLGQRVGAPRPSRAVLYKDIAALKK